jgi:hypothetical protein
LHVFLAQSFDRRQTRLNRLLQPIRQIGSRASLSKGGFGDRSIHGLIVPYQWI